MRVSQEELPGSSRGLVEGPWPHTLLSWSEILLRVTEGFPELNAAVLLQRSHHSQLPGSLR